MSLKHLFKWKISVNSVMFKNGKKLYAKMKYQEREGHQRIAITSQPERC